MKLDPLVKPSVLTQPVYEPGKPIEDVARELGIDPAGIIKLASNENPWGSSPLAVAAAKRALEHGELYPDGGCFSLRQKLATRWGLAAEQFIVGNGSNEIIELLGHVFLREGDEVVMAAPAFVVYKLVTRLFGATPVEVPLREWRHDLDAMAAAITPDGKTLFVANMLPALAAAQAAVGTITGRILNPATGEYVRNAQIRVEGTNLLVVSENGGFYSLPGVPVGTVRLSVTFTGYRTETASVPVPAGGVAVQEIPLPQKYGMRTLRGSFAAICGGVAADDRRDLDLVRILITDPIMVPAAHDQLRKAYPQLLAFSVEPSAAPASAMSDTA